MTPIIYEHLAPFLVESYRNRLSYVTQWKGFWSIQYPQDLFTIAEILRRNKPSLVIETGLANGGTTAFMADVVRPWHGSILSIDINPNNEVIHNLQQNYSNIEVIQANSTTFNIGKLSLNSMVILDSNHHAEHVLEELKLFQQLVPVNGYIVVCDTCLDFVPEGTFPWSTVKPGDGPFTAITKFLETNVDFAIDSDFERRYLITSNPRGVLQRVKK